jgi:DNA repair protein RadC
MLSFEDCVGLAELSEEEIHAIAMHEHIPEICAAELGRYLLMQKDGVPRIKRIIADDIQTARAHGDFKQAATLKLALKHFVETHPQRQAVS